VAGYICRMTTITRRRKPSGPLRTGVFTPQSGTEAARRLVERLSCQIPSGNSLKILTSPPLLIWTTQHIAGAAGRQGLGLSTGYNGLVAATRRLTARALIALALLSTDATKIGAKGEVWVRNYGERVPFREPEQRRRRWSGRVGSV
jgi:hypothetical protein